MNRKSSKKPKPIDHRVQGDIERSIQEMDTLLQTGVVGTGWPKEVFWPVITRMFIITADLVVKSETYAGKPIDFLDDVIVKDRVKNAGLLIRYIRDALCHVESSNHILPSQIYFSFNVVRGALPKNVRIHQDAPSSDYPDDIALYFGPQRVYIQRHLIRAFQEAVANLKGAVQKPPENAA